VCFITTVLSIMFIVWAMVDAGRRSNTDGGNEETLLNPIQLDYLTFFIEKYLVVVIFAVINAYQADVTHRSLFMKKRICEQLAISTDKEKTKNMQMVPLPEVIRDQLKDNEQVVIDAYGSVLFADIVSFTVFSTGLEAARLVRILDWMFLLHDDLAGRIGVDKIKTLGDCYVASTGLLAPATDHAAALIKFGIGMHAMMGRLNDKFELRGNGPFGKDLRIRVGVASGPVVGGVVGGKKFLFDIWGTTVEEAEIMESEGIPERVQISAATYLRAKKDDWLRFDKRDDVKLPGYDETSYMVRQPSNVEEWLNVLYPLEDGDAEVRKSRSISVSGGSSKEDKKNKNNKPTGPQPKGRSKPRSIDRKRAPGKRASAVFYDGDLGRKESDRKGRNQQIEMMTNPMPRPEKLP